MRRVLAAAFLMAWGAGGRSAADEAAPPMPPQAAGDFYPADPVELSAQVDAFLGKASSETAPSEPVAGALVPHAGYAYSGATAAEVYRLLQGRRYDTVVLLGTGHRAPILGAAALPGGSLSTPLGAVEIDTAAVAELKRLSPLVADQPEAFAGEHSVEVQLPFLQKTLGSFKLAPLLMNTDDPEAAAELGRAVAAFLKGRRALLLASSDLSHYPDARLARIVDLSSLAALIEAPQDPLYFWKTNRSLMEKAASPALVCTECGEAAVIAAQSAMKELGAAPRLLQYINSGELPNGDTRRAVGYGALVWLQGAAAPPRGLNADERALLLKLARLTLSAKLERGVDPPPRGLALAPELNLPAAVFVTLRKKSEGKRALRGCIGTTSAELPLADAVRAYAVKSALEDPRFAPVRPAELAELSIEISRLSPPRPARSADNIRPGQGVVLKAGGREGIFLPEVWKEIPGKEAFLSELCSQKAGLPPDCWKDPAARFEVFDAEAFSE